ncbi:MAG TPA: ABC transporter permease [Ktedonobacteraceae bacterium]|jgi:ABC-2 type transport system permease protein|nr:ABC transporter permease [Ktedonobacteraceae bacterium]
MATQTAKKSIEYTVESSNTAPLVKQILVQTKYELLLTARRGENILVTLILPVFLLIAFSSIKVIPGITGPQINFLLPGILSIAIIAAGMVNLGIATAYERYYGVLKRLGSSPLPRTGLILAKIISVLVLEVVQVILLVGVAILFFGWKPVGSPLLTLLAIILGTITFAALGLAMAGALRAEMTLAGANALFLVFILIGGGIVPITKLPGPIEALAQILPPAALSDSLQKGMAASAAFPTFSIITLVAWAVIILFVAIRTFKWE